MKHCPSCRAALVAIGPPRFENDGRMFEAVVNPPGWRLRNHLRLFACPECGAVHWALTEEGMRLGRRLGRIEEFRSRCGEPAKHPRWKEFLREDAANAFLEASERDHRFVEWLGGRSGQ